MSLRFIFGNSGSGKSHYLFEHVITESMKFPERKYIVLVPEQFTLQTQRELVLRHPRRGIMNIDVLSFLRLALRVLEENGEDGRIILDDEGKNLILRKIAGKLEPDLKVLQGKLKKPGYISEVKSVISEFSQYNITPADIDEMKKVAGEQSYLGYKLGDIQVIYQAFEEFLAEKYVTQEEILELLSRVICRSKMLKDATVVLDGFTGFTPVQNKVLREMLKYCRDVEVTVTCDKRENPYVLEDKYQLFAMSKQMVTSLVQIAKEEQVTVEDAVELYTNPVYRFKDAPALAHLEQQMFRAKRRCYEEPQENIHIYEAKNPKEEILLAAQKIRRLVRTKGWRYSDIAVITGDMNIYGDEIERIFADYQIPVFMDYKRSVLLNPFVEYIRSLLDMAEKNFTGESVIRFLRTELVGFSRTEVDILENYIRALGIKGYKKWQEKWIRRGKNTTEEELEFLNSLRVRFVETVDEMVLILKQKRKTVRDVSEALCRFFVKENLQKKIKAQEELFTEQGELALAKEYAQIYKVVLELFDKFVALLGDEIISVSEYAKLLEAGMEEARIGVIPPGVDEVVVGDIERTRLKNVKALILLGVNDTLIPGSVMTGGLLSERDKSRFEENGITLAPGAKEKAYIQKFYLYLHMTKPTEQLILTFSRVSSEGKSIRPANLISELRKLFSYMPVKAVEGLGTDELELVPNEGKNLLVKGLRERTSLENESWQQLYRWFVQQEEWKEEIETLVDASMYRKPEDALTRQTARRLFGDREISVSKAEKFAACAYLHFLEYGLRVKEREEYQFRPLDFGTVVHAALEKYAYKVEQNASVWGEIDEEQQKLWIEEAVNESIVDYNNTLLYSSARNAYMIPRIKRMMGRTVWAMTKQLQHGEFYPEGHEVEFESGKIDRIDVCESGEEVYVKVIDYKTGKTEFDMTAFYHGLQIQLVIYMAEALELEKKKHPGKKTVPAGIFYYHIKDPIVDKEVDPQMIEEAILKKLRLDGIVNRDDTIVRKLDGMMGSKSLVIPVDKTSKGYAKTTKALATEEFEDVIHFAKEQKRKLQDQMKSGYVEANPYQMGSETKCEYCRYKHICGFDEQIEGYEYRQLERMPWERVLKKIKSEIENGKEE